MITRCVVKIYAVIPQKRPTGIIFFCWFKGTHYIVSTRNCGYYSKEVLFRGNKEISSQFWIMNRSHFCPTLGCNKNVLFGMDFSVLSKLHDLNCLLNDFQRLFFTLWVLFLFQIIISNMDLKEVYGVYGKPHRMFIQAMLTRGIIASGELKKLFELIMKRCGGEPFGLFTCSSLIC